MFKQKDKGRQARLRKVFRFSFNKVDVSLTRVGLTLIYSVCETKYTLRPFSTIAGQILKILTL